METMNPADSANGTMGQTSLTDTVRRMEETCKNCNPLSMLTCIAGCSIWKLKNEFRGLHKKLQDPDFATHLLNALKNKRRLQVLEIISKGRISTSRLQQELGKLNHSHSQKTIIEEYIEPLVEVGLATQDQDKYFATLFGYRLNELTKRFHDIVDVLPPHSECYEETVLTALLSGPRIHEALEGVIPAGNVARVLSRLQSGGLVKTAKENDYVFFFKTQRNPNKEILAPTEKKVYGNITEDGISARRLAERTNIPLRRTYKYLRRLKGKKLVFTREKPKSYALTDEGVQAALALQSIRNLAKEVLEAAKQVLGERETRESAIATTCELKYEKKVEAATSRIVGPARRNQANS